MRDENTAHHSTLYINSASIWTFDLAVNQRKRSRAPDSIDEGEHLRYFSLVLLVTMSSTTSSSPRNPLAATTENTDNHNNSTSTRYITIKFEVSGKVQGVFFRKYTKAKAEELGLTGFCRNTPRGTVQGEFEYAASSSSSAEIDHDPSNNKEAIAFQKWLCTVGSPKSRIDDCTFSDGTTSFGARKFDTFRVIR